MSTQDIHGLREQILANARFLLRHPQTDADSAVGYSVLPNVNDLHIVVSGEVSPMRGVVMLGHLPAIQGGEAPTVEGALRKLLIAVAEVMSTYLPKIGEHHRNIHGNAREIIGHDLTLTIVGRDGGIFDVDLIASELREAQKEAKEAARKST